MNSAKENLSRQYDLDKDKYEIDKHILSLYPAWIYATLIGDGEMIKLTNLYGLCQLGSELQELSSSLDGKKTYDEIEMPCIRVIGSLNTIMAGEVLPLVAVQESANKLMETIKKMIFNVKGNWAKPFNPLYASLINKDIVAFQFALSEELRQLPTYIATGKGNLSIARLVDGASKGYSAKTRDIVDDFIRFEIDEAGRCLAFGLFTACGFHILRSVEIAIKGYFYAIKGYLPKLTKRNWGEYITQLDGVASTELIDCLKILKTKRNPLMHPQDKLEKEDAIGLFNMCESTMDQLTKDIFNKSLEKKFKGALVILPTL